MKAVFASADAGRIQTSGKTPVPNAKAPNPNNANETNWRTLRQIRSKKFNQLPRAIFSCGSDLLKTGVFYYSVGERWRSIGDFITIPAMRLSVMFAGFAFGLLGLAAGVWGEELTLTPNDRVLIMAPHPDDEVLCCGGIIQEAVQQHMPVKIVFFTYGDYNKWSFSLYRHHPVFRPKAMRAMGAVRHDEAVAAAGVLGVSPDQLVFLGYPDFETMTLWKSHWGRSPALESRHTRVQAVPYSTALRPGAAYKGEEILLDLETIVRDFKPTKIFVSHPADQMPDHRALFLFTRAALRNLPKESFPDLYGYLVHFGAWPEPRGRHQDAALIPPIPLKDREQWMTFPLSGILVNKKYAALEKHRSQYGYSRRFLTSFVRANELFDRMDTSLSVVLPGQDSNLQPSR